MEKKEELIQLPTPQEVAPGAAYQSTSGARYDVATVDAKKNMMTFDVTKPDGTVDKGLPMRLDTFRKQIGRLPPPTVEQ